MYYPLKTQGPKKRNRKKYSPKQSSSKYQKIPTWCGEGGVRATRMREPHWRNL